ncbi:hypothetical protein [Hymenobacter sp. HSC-4F20]|uniref:hypothetical protein n=1 Tax=Hymenobacter sp. HSC-4F20 TaxID=2864135 RepID=UPI001C72CB29|nr:hypothetical protein [Hymenobacter sp. HSC-4F20]
MEQPAAAPPEPVVEAPPAPVVSTDTLATLTWESEICLHTGRYNPKRYTAAQLLGTWEVLEHSASLNYHALTFTPADIDKLSLDSLEADYTKLHEHYQQLQVVPQPVWQQLKMARLRELENEYKAKRLLIQAYTTPELLLTAPYPDACTQYIRGLAARNDSLIRRDWERLIRQEAKQNGEPGSLLARFHDQLNSPDWYRYAQVELLNAGWWNCVNRALPQAELTPRMHQQYEHLFSQVRTECEEAD